jgi:PAS domain S-box-containing protein
LDLSALQANKNLDFQQLFIIFDQLEDMMFLISVDDLSTFRFTHINPAYVRNTGIQLAQIRNKQTEDIFQPDDAQAMNANYQKAIMSKQKLSYEEQLTIGRRKRTYETTIIPIFQEHTKMPLYCRHLKGY